MILREFFYFDKQTFEPVEDKSYDPTDDESVVKRDDTRKTRLTLKDINKMRLASEQHDAEQKEEATFVQKMYGQPATDDNLTL